MDYEKVNKRHRYSKVYKQFNLKSNTTVMGDKSQQTVPTQQATTSAQAAATASTLQGENISAELEEIKNLLWGSTVRSDVFTRWSQGFEFSNDEPTALVQRQGGPCAVIAPVQAYLIKLLIMEGQQYLSKVTMEQRKLLLTQALCAILSKSSTEKCRIVVMPEQGVDAIKVTKDIGDAEASVFVEALPETFHQQLRAINFNNIDEVQNYFLQNFDMFLAQYGVLIFLYSVLLTKGIENVHNEVLDTSEPLIHDTYGYGSQALINLMLTGRAVAHVWDNDQDVGGLKLCGINEQSDIGFITLMEQLRYCTVGSFYKNPRFPVWVMASETHLTVLFSFEKRLVSAETPSESARRVFKSYDPDGNNFIPTSVLQDVLAALDLVSETEYVDIMQKRLDPENLGIILLNAFMDEFFPQERTSTPDTFDLFHYNGIPGSNIGNKVRYYRGSAVMLECDIKSVCTSNPMLTCLQTKWPNIEINWHCTQTPSLN